MTPRRMLCAFLWAILAVAAGRAQEKPVEEWAVVTINGARAGYSFYSRATRPEADRSAAVESISRMRMSIQRMGVRLDVFTEIKAYETADGQPLRFVTRAELSSQPSITEGVIEGTTLRLKTVTSGMERTSERPWDPECLLSEGVRLETIRRGFAPGTKYSYKTWSIEQSRVETVDVEIVGPERLRVMGEERELTKMLARSSLSPGVEMRGWVDREGSAWVSEMDVVGLQMRIERASKEEARKQGAAELPEVFFQTMPRSNVALPRPREITSMTLRIERPGGALDKWTPPGGTQEVVARDANSVTLRILCAPPDKPATRPVATTGELSEFLKPSPNVQSDDPGISAKARELVGEERDALMAARKLTGWVYKHMSRKRGMDVGAASAKEVFATGEGDCSEHAVLLAAMLRAAGIPAKVCTGYMYIRGLWGGHAWTSAWVGSWMDLDAAFNVAPADTARIKFSETEPGEQDALIEGTTQAGFMHGEMKIEVLEYALDGQVRKVGPPATQSEHHFSAPLLGVSFEKPSDWSFQSGRELPPFVLGVLAAPDGKAEIRVSYIDLSYDEVSIPLAKLARRLGADAGGERSKIAGCEAYDDGEKHLFLRLSPAEVLEFEYSEGEPARAALEHVTKTLKVSRD